MADSSHIIVDVQNQQARPVKFHDNGDGTFSIAIYEMGSGGGDNSSPSDSIGGGNSVYSNVQGDFTATANNGAKTITFSGYASAVLSAVLANINLLNAVIMRRSSAGIVDTLPLTNVSFSSNVLTLSDMAANFAAGDTIAVYVTGPDKGFDKTLDSQKTTMTTAIATNTDSISAKLATDALQSGLVSLTLKFAIIDHATSGDNTLVAAVTGKKIRVVALHLVNTSVLTARFESGAGGTALSGQIALAANHGYVLPLNPVGLFETAAGALLNLESLAATSVDGGLTYIEV